MGGRLLVPLFLSGGFGVLGVLAPVPVALVPLWAVAGFVVGVLAVRYALGGRPVTADPSRSGPRL